MNPAVPATGELVLHHYPMSPFAEKVRLEAMLAIGHGPSAPMTSDEAIALAARSDRAPVGIEPGLGFEAGEAVTVTPTDYGFDPVAGRLVGLSRDSVTVERRDARAGTVHVHFPRIGFQIRKERAP